MTLHVFRQTLSLRAGAAVTLAALAACGVNTDRAPRATPDTVATNPADHTLSDSTLAREVLARYSEVDTVAHTGRIPINRFARVGASARAIEPTDSSCGARLTYSDGLFCSSYTAPVRTRPLRWQPGSALDSTVALVRRGFGEAHTALVDRIAFDELVSFSAGACVSFQLRELAKPSRDAQDDDIYAQHARLFADFICDIDATIRSPMKFAAAQDSASRAYGALGLVRVWDVFEYSRSRLLLVAETGCAGECEDFAVYDLTGRTMVLLGRIHLWAI